MSGQTVCVPLVSCTVTTVLETHRQHISKSGTTSVVEILS